MCEAALATYLTLSAPLLWQPVQKRDRFSRTTNFTRSHTPQHAAMLFRMSAHARGVDGRIYGPYKLTFSPSDD